MLGQGGVSTVPGSAQGDLPQWNGIYYGSVSNNADPLKQNRCLLRVPQILGSGVTTWAASLTPQQVVPVIGAVVVVVFIGGDLDYPAYYPVNPVLAVETSAANVKPVGTTASAGTSTKYAAADHVHGSINTTAATITTSSPTTTATAGASGELADAAHVHALANVVPSNASSTITGTLTITGGLTADSTLIVTAGYVTVDGDLTVDTNFSVNGTVEGSLNVNGSIVSTGTNEVACGGQLTVGGNAFVTGETVCTGEIFAQGGIQISSAPSNTLTSPGSNTITSPGTTYSQAWCDEVQSTVGNMFVAIDNLVNTVNGIWIALF